MSTIADKELGRFLENGRPEHIGRVFDELSPELFKLAVHLSGDVHVAEDLVQQTFLTLLEKLDAFDRRRPLLPWLCGVLAFHARARRRKDGRLIDADRYVASRDGNEAGRADAEQAAIEVIGRLEEPYRESLLLRFVHGLDAAEIARKLDRSPGTVRVQLHRGIAMLRDLLPPSERPRLTSITGALASSGLGRIRDVILSKASTTTIASSLAVGLIGGLVVMKKIVAAVSIVLLLIGAWWFVERRGDEDASLVHADAATSSTTRPVGGSQRPALPAAVSAGHPLTASIGDDKSIGGRFNGVVRERSTGSPISGAVVTAFGPRRGNYRELSSLWPGSTIDSSGSSEDGAWPLVLEDLDDLALTGRRPVLILDGGCAAQTPLAQATTDAAGRFAMALDADGVFMTCSSSGFATQCRAIRDFGAPIEFSMTHLWRLEGVVVDAQGEPVRQTLELIFKATVGVSGSADTRPQARSAWSEVVVTTPKGAFAASMASDAADVHVLTPGFAIVGARRRGDDAQAIADSRPQIPGLATKTTTAVRVGRGERAGGDGPIELILERVALLRVIDGDTLEPIPKFSVVSRWASNHSPWWLMGSQTTTAGEVALVRGGEWIAPSGDSTPGFTSGLEFTVWTDGYRPTTVLVPSLAAGTDVQIALERGEMPTLDGIVTDGSAPCDEAVVTLLVASEGRWYDNRQGLLDATRTVGGGAFRFLVPPGRYLLRVVVGDRKHLRTVDVPQTTPLVLDFGHQARIEATVSDENKRPLSNHVVLLSGSDGRSQLIMTDERGCAVFEYLPSGNYQVAISYSTTEGSFVTDQERSLVLAEGERSAVAFELPGLGGTRRAKLVTRPTSDLATFSARRLSGRDINPVAVESSGYIPIDFKAGGIRLEIRSPDGALWQRDIPRNAPDGHEIVIDLDGRGYDGLIVDAASGEPVSGVIVEAWPRSRTPRPSWLAQTDMNGRFRLVGLSDQDFDIVLSRSAPAGPAGSGGVRSSGVFFLARPRPSDPLSPLRIELPPGLDCAGRAEVIRYTGSIERAGRPFVGARLALWSVSAQRDGTLRVRLTTGSTVTAADGQFLVEGLRADGANLSVYGDSPVRVLLEKDLPLVTDRVPEPLRISID